MIQHNIFGCGKLDGIMLIRWPFIVRIRGSDSDVSDNYIIGILIIGGVQMSNQCNSCARGCLTGNG